MITDIWWDIEEGELDDLTEENPNVFYQLADCDDDDEKSVDNNIDMESVENCDDIDMESIVSCEGQ